LLWYMLNYGICYGICLSVGFVNISLEPSLVVSEACTSNIAIDILPGSHGYAKLTYMQGHREVARGQGQNIPRSPYDVIKRSQGRSCSMCFTYYSDAPISTSVYRYRLIGTKIEISVSVILLLI
jgi:hypothetical protein